MKNLPPLEADSAAVQSYLSMMQNVINRMATNSTNCKAWCITLVSAIIVVVPESSQVGYVWIALLPTFLFFFLDTYYLLQEKGFRRTYNNFVAKLHKSLATSIDLYVLRATANSEGQLKDLIEALSSFSILPFYLVLAIAILIGHYLIS